MTDVWDRAAHAALVLARARALTVACEYCRAQIGDECVSREGVTLAMQPAHTVRLRDAQAAP